MPIGGQFGCNLHVLAERTVYVKYESCRIEHVRKLQTDRPETTHPDHWIRWYMYENNIKQLASKVEAKHILGEKHTKLRNKIKFVKHILSFVQKQDYSLILVNTVFFLSQRETNLLVRCNKTPTELLVKVEKNIHVLRSSCIAIVRNLLSVNKIYQAYLFS